MSELTVGWGILIDKDVSIGTLEGVDLVGHGISDRQLIVVALLPYL